MNKYTNEWVQKIINNQPTNPYQKISDSIDYFLALILQKYPDVDVITVEKYVSLINTNYFFKYWKQHEFDLFMLDNFINLYEKVSPLKNNWPQLREKYTDITESINNTLNTDGNTQVCQDEPSEKDVTKYIVAIINQANNYNTSNSTSTIMNKNFIDDFQKILNLPSNTTVLNNAILALQPYVYVNNKECGGCGYCSMCVKQSFDTNEAYYIDIMKHLKTLEDKMAYFDWKKRGPEGKTGPAGEAGPEGPQGPLGPEGPHGPEGKQGPTGPEGPTGPKGDKGDKGDKGEKGDSGGSAPLWEVVDTSDFEKTSSIYAIKDDYWDRDNFIYKITIIPTPYGAASLPTEHTFFTKIGFKVIQASSSGTVNDTTDDLIYNFIIKPNGQIMVGRNLNNRYVNITIDGVHVERLAKEKWYNGIQGLQGVKGDTGAQGPRGEQGATGPQGIQGPTGPQGPAGKQQFTDEQAQRLLALLDKTAFGVNKVTEKLEQKGFFTEQTFYNDLDKPSDNMVTDSLGNELEAVRKVAFMHYSGTGWYKSDKSLGVRYYQDKLTYNGDEVATVNAAYHKLLEVSVNSTEYVFNGFDNNKWYLFNVEYVGGDNKNYAGTLERMGGLTVSIPDCNVANDFGLSSSATIMFDGATKKLVVKRWEQINLKITKITIFEKIIK